MTDETQGKILPPEMIIKRSTEFIHKDDIERVLMDKLPGYIPDISGGGQWPGCRIIEFGNFGVVHGLQDDVLEYFQSKFPEYGKSSAVAAMNKFFETFANYMLVWRGLDSHGSIFVEYTSMLDQQDTADLQETSDRIRQEMNKKRAERKAKEEEESARIKVETDELMKLGKLAKEQNIIEKNREYVNEIHDLRNEIKKLKKANNNA